MGSRSYSRRVSEKRRRVFVGVPVSDIVTETVKKWQDTHRVDYPVRWIEGENLHLTIVPPWDVEEDRKVTRVLGKISTGVEPFELEFHTIAYGPSGKKPRLIWVSADTPKEYTRLCKTVAQKLKRPRPDRDPKVHLTIARFHPNDIDLLPGRHLAEGVTWKTSVDRLVLYESHLLPTGAHYDRLYEVEL